MRYILLFPLTEEGGDLLKVVIPTLVTKNCPIRHENVLECQFKNNY